MKFYGTFLPGLEIVSNNVFTDNRGYFYETYKTATDNMRGMFRQLNTAKSNKNVLRGMHRQNQTKLVMPVDGVIFDVALNTENGEWFGIELDHTVGLLIPPQYAHGYLVLSDTAIVQYIVDAPYNKAEEENLMWDAYGIQWPLTEPPILSDKDNGK